MTALYETQRGDRVAVFRNRGGRVLPGEIVSATLDHRVVQFDDVNGKRVVAFRCWDGIARGSRLADVDPWRCAPVSAVSITRAREIRVQIGAMLEPLDVATLEQLLATLAEILPPSR